VIHSSNGKPIGKIGMANGHKVLQPIVAPGMSPAHAQKSLTLPAVGTVIHNSNGKPVGKIGMANGHKVLQPIVAPSISPANAQKSPTVLIAPTVSANQKQTKPTALTAPSVSANQKQKSPTALTAPSISTPQTKPNATPNATPTAVPGKTVPAATAVVTKTNNGGASTHHNMPTDSKSEKPGFIERTKQWLFGKEGKTDKIIEPGIRNKEVEAYRTNDAKEVIYKDTIIQDDKNVTLPKTHLK